MSDLYEQARAALGDDRVCAGGGTCDGCTEEGRQACARENALLAILDLHKPYVSEPAEIADAVSLDPDRGLVGDWREPDEFERITSRRLWCDACRSDAPCPTYAVILGALGLSASTEESRA